MSYVYPPIRVIGLAGFDRETAQTPGSNRLAAIAPELCIGTTMWGGLFEMEPGACIGIYRHGKQQTTAWADSANAIQRATPAQPYCTAIVPAHFAAVHQTARIALTENLTAGYVQLYNGFSSCQILTSTAPARNPASQ